MIDDIAIDLWFLEILQVWSDIRRKCNPMVNLSKFTSNKKILSWVIALVYNQVCQKFNYVGPKII